MGSLPALILMLRIFCKDASFGAKFVVIVEDEDTLRATQVGCANRGRRRIGQKKFTKVPKRNLSIVNHNVHGGEPKISRQVDRPQL